MVREPQPLGELPAVRPAAAGLQEQSVVMLCQDSFYRNLTEDELQNVKGELTGAAAPAGGGDGARTVRLRCTKVTLPTGCEVGLPGQWLMPQLCAANSMPWCRVQL